MIHIANRGNSLKTKGIAILGAGSLLLAAACGGGSTPETPEQPPTAPAASSEPPAGQKDASELRRIDRATALSDQTRAEICRATFVGLFKKTAEVFPEEPRGENAPKVTNAIVKLTFGEKTLVSASYGEYQKDRKLTEEDCVSNQTVTVFETAKHRELDLFGFSRIPQSSVVFNDGKLEVVDKLNLPALNDIAASETLIPKETEPKYFSQPDLANFEIADAFARDQLA